MKKLLSGLLALIVVGVAAPTSQNTSCQLFTLPKEKKSLQSEIREKISYIGKFISYTEGKNGGSGTCFPVKTVKDPKGFTVYFITNNHNVIGDKCKIEFYGDPGIGFTDKITKTLFDTKIVLRDSVSDIAIIKAKSDTYIPCLYMDYSLRKSFNPVFTVGFPLGMFPHYTRGELTTRIINGPRIRWATSCPIVFGNSGGPVIDSWTGKIVGISCAIISSGEGPYYNCTLMIPLSSCWRLIEKALHQI